jgi:hypothetical protein
VRGFKRLGKESWRRHVTDVVKRLKNALSGGAREKEGRPLAVVQRLGLLWRKRRHCA